MQEFLNWLYSLPENPGQIVGLVSGFAVFLAAIIGIIFRFTPGARLKRKLAKQEYKKYKNLEKAKKKEYNINLLAQKQLEKESKKEAVKNYSDDLISLSIAKRKVHLTVNLDNNENTSIVEELTKGYLHATKLIENGNLKIKI